MALTMGVLLLLAAPLPAPAATPGEVPAGQPLREATMRGLNGPDRKLSELQGRPMVINVWASWCGPCRAEMASLERLAWLEPTKAWPTSFRIVGISTDDDFNAARELLRKTGATISHYIDRQLELEHMLGADRLPLTLVVDARGVVRAKVVGAREWDAPAQRTLIEQALSGKAVGGTAPGGQGTAVPRKP